MARRIALLACGLVGAIATALAVYATLWPARDGWSCNTRTHRATAIVEDSVFSFRWCWFHAGAGSDSDVQIFDFPQILPERMRLRAHRYSCSFPTGIVDRPGCRSYTYVTADMPVWLPAVALIAWPLTRLTVAAWRRLHRHRNQLCLGCGYALRGLPVARCPECGASTQEPVVWTRAAEQQNAACQ